jgi:hypothetical protein
MPVFRPKTYQDLKQSLLVYTLGILIILSFFTYHWLLPRGHQEFFASAFGIFNNPNGFAGWTLWTVILAIVAYIGIFLLEIHDRVYDKYFVHWRYYYDVDFIIPTLYWPFADKLDRRFFEEARDKKKKDAFIKPFYHFVGDGDGEHRIEENTRVRFYESVLKYWITQINELLMILFVVFVFIYIFIYRGLSLPLEPLFIAMFILVLVFIANRLAIQPIKKTIRQRTLSEIEEIHEKYLDVLEQELRKLCAKFSLAYAKDKDIA